MTDPADMTPEQVCQWFDNPHPKYPTCGKPAEWVWFGLGTRGKGQSRRTINWTCFYCDEHKRMFNDDNRIEWVRIVLPLSE